MDATETVVTDSDLQSDQATPITVDTDSNQSDQTQQDEESVDRNNSEFYTDEEIISMVARGESFDENKLSPLQASVYKPFKGDYTKKTQALAQERQNLESEKISISQMKQFTRQAMEKAMKSAPVEDQIYFQYVQNPQGTTMEIEAASRELYMKSIDDTLPIEERRQAADGHLTLNKTIAGLQTRVQNDQRMQGYTRQLTEIADKAVLEMIPDLVEKAPKLDTFISEQGLDMKLAAALTNPLVLENICRTAGINLNGAQAKAQVVKLINNLYDKTAGVVAKTKTAAPPKTLASRSATPIGSGTGGDSQDPFDPKLSTEERIELFRKLKSA